MKLVTDDTDFNGRRLTNVAVQAVTDVPDLQTVRDTVGVRSVNVTVLDPSGDEGILLLPPNTSGYTLDKVQCIASIPSGNPNFDFKVVRGSTISGGTVLGNFTCTSKTVFQGFDLGVNVNAGQAVWLSFDTTSPTETSVSVVLTYRVPIVLV